LHIRATLLVRIRFPCSSETGQAAKLDTASPGLKQREKYPLGALAPPLDRPPAVVPKKKCYCEIHAA
jgi:hypothetical protein